MKYLGVLLLLVIGFSCAFTNEDDQKPIPGRAPITLVPVFIAIENRANIPLYFTTFDGESSIKTGELPGKRTTKLALWGSWLANDRSDSKEQFLHIALPEELGPTPLVYNRRVTILLSGSYSLHIIAEEDPWAPFGIKVRERDTGIGTRETASRTVR